MPRFNRFKYDAWAEGAFRVFNFHVPKTIAIDTETSGFGYHDAAFCVTVTWRSGGALCSAYLDLEFDESGTRHEMVRQMLKLAQVWVFHNAKFDLQKLELAGILQPGWNGRRIEDTATLYALINENDRKGLKYLAHKFLHEDTNEEKVLAKVRRKLKIKKDDGYHLIPREFVAPYAMKDTEYTLRLLEFLRPKLPQDMDELYDFEIELERALLEIEGNGIGVDVAYLDKTTSEYGVKLMKLDAQLRKLSGNDTFNPNSPKQIIEAFEQRGIPVAKTDKAQLSTMDDAMAVTLLEYRKVKKLHSTYLLGMQAEQRDGIIHPNFNLTTPRTGRMSSGAATNN